MPTDDLPTDLPTDDTTSVAQSGPSELDAEAILAYWTEDRRRAARPVQPPDIGRADDRLDEVDRSAAPSGTDADPGPPDPSTDPALTDPTPTDPAPTGPQVISTARVAHPDQYPHRTVGKLFFRRGNEDHVASAAVVNRAGILTAAHCVRDHRTGEWSTHVTFAPGYHGHVPAFGIWPVGVMFTPSQWPANTDHDFSFCRVPERNGSQIGDAVGWLGITVNQHAIRYWNNHGYPAAAIPGFPFDGHQMWNCGGDHTQTVGATIRKQGNLTPGASGGPWIVRSDDGSFFANGTCSKWFGNPPTENSSPFFGHDVLNLFGAAFG